MATKEILTGEESRKAFLLGVDKVANPTILSLGAKGKSIAIAEKYRTRLTKDGVSIVKAIELTDETERSGGNLIKEVAIKTLIEAGDSTTCATLIAQAIIHEGFKLLSAGHNGHSLKVGIDKAVEIVVGKLKKISERIEIGSTKLKQIATISANNDATIGSIVSEAYVKTGKDGVISIDDSVTGKTHLKVVEGMQFDSGYLSVYFINNESNLSCQLDNPYILLSEGKISTLKQVHKVLDAAFQEKRQVLIIAEDVEGEALSTIILNARKGYPICVIKSPGFGDSKKDMLKDIAAVVGGNIASEETGQRVDLLTIKDLGSASKILITRDETTIVGGGGNRTLIDSRVSFIRKSIELNSENTYEKEQLERRLAKLAGGVGVIYVGAATKVELGELKDRCDDSLRATKCAIDEGIVVGGGIAYIRCIESLNDVKGESDDETAGIKLVQRVLEAPFRQMVKNASLDISINDVKKGDYSFGYNFKTDKFEDLVESGVIDPVKSLRSALVNASSVAGTLLTSEALIIQSDDAMSAMRTQM